MYLDALDLAWQIGDRRRVAFCLEGLSQATIETDSEHATYWLSAAAELRQVITAPLPPAEQTKYDQTMAELRTRLSPAIFEAAWQYGRLTPLDEVVAPLLMTA